MPTTEYICRYCGAQFKRIVLLGSAEKGISCPRCGTTEVTRIESTRGLFQGISNHSALAGDRD